MKITGLDLQANALRVLRQIPGVSVVADDRPLASKPGVDAILHFAGSDSPVAVQFKSRANAATAWQLVRYAEDHPGLPLILTAEETTTEARSILQRHGVGLADGVGNVHVELPGLLLHLEGRARARGTASAAPTRLRGKAAVVAQALLLAPKRYWHVHEMAREAGVSTGLVHRVLSRLEVEGLVISKGLGPKRVRQLSEPGALLDLWAEENVDQPRRTSAYVLARSPHELIHLLGGELGSHGIAYAITGAGAASLVAPFVTAIPVVQVWVAEQNSPDGLLDAAGAEPVADGENVILLQAKGDTPLAFREEWNGTWLVNRFRLYVDLRRDPRRGKEQANHLREEVIGF